MNVSIDELVAVVDVKLASLVGAVKGAGGCCQCRPAGGALYLAGVVKTSLTVGGVGFGLWSWADGEGLGWYCVGGVWLVQGNRVCPAVAGQKMSRVKRWAALWLFGLTGGLLLRVLLPAQSVGLESVVHVLEGE